MNELKNKIYGALSDPEAPWYGSDLVTFVGDYIKELEELLVEYGRHCPGCSQEFGTKYRCRCGWDKVERALKG